MSHLHFHLFFQPVFIQGPCEQDSRQGAEFVVTAVEMNLNKTLHVKDDHHQREEGAFFFFFLIEGESIWKGTVIFNFMSTLHGE